MLVSNCDVHILYRLVAAWGRPLGALVGPRTASSLGPFMACILLPPRVEAGYSLAVCYAADSFFIQSDTRQKDRAIYEMHHTYALWNAIKLPGIRQYQRTAVHLGHAIAAIRHDLRNDCNIPATISMCLQYDTVENDSESFGAFDVEREYRQRRMSVAGQDLFHTNRLLGFASDQDDIR
ncbi:unnamed protein product [Colias eurytheme]|nr:unnamed protein product [Colias eurytheme]